MFILLELGQVVTPGGNSLGFAVVGVPSKTLYLPLSAMGGGEANRGPHDYAGWGGYDDWFTLNVRGMYRSRRQ